MTEDQAIEKLRRLMPYWITHNNERIRDNEKWRKVAESLGLKAVAAELRATTELLKEANRHIESANKRIDTKTVSGPVPDEQTKMHHEMQCTEMRFELKPIGIIRSPYSDNAPYQPVDEADGDFRIVLAPKYARGLDKLAKFRYIYVIYYTHRVKRGLEMVVCPPWAGGAEVGLFASRSPVRPNCIGLSIVRIKRIVNNEIFTSGLDAFDGTPVLDIKPYIKDLDTKSDANYGWLTELDGYEHLILHIKGIPHDY